MIDGTSTDERPRLAVTYDITSSSPMELKAMLGDLCEIVWVIDGTDPSLGSMARFLRRLGTVIDIGGHSRGEVVDAIRAVGVAGIIAFTDTQLALAADVATALGLPGNPPEAVARLNDKYAQREAFAAAGLAVPRFVRIPGGTDADRGVALAAALTFPIVVKPLVGDSSRDVVRIDDVTALREWFTDGPGATRDVTTDFIAEEYLLDREGLDREGLDREGLDRLASYVSVESIVSAGRPVPVALTGKFPLVEPFRETGNFMPHPLDAAEAAAVLDLSVAATHALGVRSGALHTEIKLTPDGPRLIEVNGRIGGGAIDLLYSRRFGHSMTELAAQVALGLPVDLVAEAPEESSGPFLYEFFAQPPVTARGLAAINGGEQIVGVAGATTVAPNKSPGDELDWRAMGSQGFVLRVGGVAADRAVLATVPTAIIEAAGIEYSD